MRIQCKIRVYVSVMYISYICNQVVEIISGAIGDLMAAEFTRLKDRNGTAVLPSDGSGVSAWEEQTYLSTGSLLAKSCKAVLMLAYHSKDLQQHAFNFGRYMGLAHQVGNIFKHRSSNVHYYIS